MSHTLYSSNSQEHIRKLTAHCKLQFSFFHSHSSLISLPHTPFLHLTALAPFPLYFLFLFFFHLTQIIIANMYLFPTLFLSQLHPPTLSVFPCGPPWRPAWHGSCSTGRSGQRRKPPQIPQCGSLQVFPPGC